MPVTSELTPRRRVEIALRGGHCDRVPFTIYESKIPQCSAERAMRNRGMCIVHRTTPVFRMHRPNVKVHAKVYTDEQGRHLTRTWYETPVGTLTSLSEPAGYTTWHHEKLFKSVEDYKALRFLLADEQYEPCYASFARAQEAMGEDVIMRTSFGLEPMQTLISGGLIDMQQFAMEWMDHRDDILALYRVLVANHRRIYPLVAQSPVLHANYGGNVVPALIGPDIFRDHYVPHYNEAAEVMHKHGKIIGCHFDDDCRLLAPMIAGTDLDYVEAFTPDPDTDMTLAEARAAWPNKVIWFNYPSSVHLKSDADVKQTMIDLLDQAGSADGLLSAVTEDVPEHRWQDSCRAIMDGIDEHARRRPAWYA